MIAQRIEFSDIFAANCYFYIDEKTKHGFIIDPSAHAEKLLEIIKQNGWTIEKILITHSHLDHIGAVLELADKLNIKFYGLNTAAQYLTDTDLSAHFSDSAVLKNMQYVKDGDEIVLSANPDVKLQVIATPGHTIDSVVYHDSENKIAFTGDTIFQSGIGRTDIQGSGGNYAALMQNIKQKIFTLPDDTVLYPGHGEQTTVKAEK